MNINIVSAEIIVGSAIQQATANPNGAATVPVEQLEQLQDFLSSINTSVSLLQVKKAFVEDRKNARTLAEQYFETLLVEARLQILDDAVFVGLNKDSVWGEEVYDKIKTMLPLRNRIIEFIIAVYESAGDTSVVHGFMKKLLQLHFDHSGTFKYVDSTMYWRSDPLRWLIYECFLYVAAYLIKLEKFEELQALVCQHYQVCCVDANFSDPPSKEYRSVDFSSFTSPIPSINDQCRRAKHKLHNPRKHLLAELVVENIDETHVTKQELMEADTFLFFVSCFHIYQVRGEYWLPSLMAYHTGELDIFKKAVSGSIFSRLLPMLKITTEEDFFQAYQRIMSSTDLHRLLQRELHVTPRPVLHDIKELNQQA